jgi:CheY-like chemotaxis protein
VVLLNLASNAADAMPEGGRLVLETQQVTLDREFCRQRLEVRPGDYVLLVVSDTGHGMDTATREQVFDPFFTTKEVGKGTGLGLSSAYGIVKGHGGHIFCYSEPGQGSTFKIYLPVFAPEAAPAPLEEVQLEEAGLVGRETVLLADDEPGLRDFLSRVLREKGYQVLTAASGEQALEIYRAQDRRPDLVILDLGMPGMGGRKALGEMLALDPEAKVLIASGYSANGQVKASLQAGARGYVPKPFTRLDLLVAVRKALDGK